MPSTYTLISANTLSTATPSVTFSAIPATFTDLVVRMSARSVTNGTNLRVRVNGLTTTIYSSTFIFGSGVSVASNRRSNATGLVLDDTSVPNNATANTFNSFELYLPSYTANQNKPVSSFYTQENNSSVEGASYINANAGLIRTAAAISEISFALATGDTEAGSSFYLYGVKNS